MVKTVPYFILAFLFAILSFYVYFNYEGWVISRLIDELDPINSTIIQSHNTYQDFPLLEVLKENNPEYTEKLKVWENKYGLCEIEYSQYGIYYLFKCEYHGERGYIDQHDMYYLIKILDVDNKDYYLRREQFIDYCGKPKTLANNWYFIHKAIYFD